MIKGILTVLCLFASLLAQDSPPKQEKVRVFVTDQATEVSARDQNQNSGEASVGTQDPEFLRALNKSCPAITITKSQSRSDFVVVWHSRPSEQTKWGEHENNFVIYDRSGDLVGSGETHLKSNAAKDICKLLVKASESGAKSNTN